MSAGPAVAGGERGFWSASIDAGLIWNGGKNEDIWKSGSSAGLSASYAVTGAIDVGVHVGLSRWTFEELPIVETLLPPGATLLARQSAGQLEIVELTPTVRLFNGRLLGPKIGTFALVGGGLYYIKSFALSEIMYQSGARPVVERFEFDEWEVTGGVMVAAGLSYAISSESWIELYPVYRAIFESDGRRSVWGFAAAFRLDFLGGDTPEPQSP